MATGIFSDMRRAIFSYRFALSVLGALLLYMISSYDMGFQQAIRWGTKRHLLDYLGDAQTVAIMSLLPFAAVLPFGASFAEDWEFHAHHYFLARMNSLNYRVSKVLAAAVSGGLSLLLAMVLFLAVLFPFSTLDPQAVSTNFVYMNGIVQKGEWVKYFSFQLALTFLYGAIWASSSMALSCITVERSLLYCCPILLESILLRVCRLIGIPGLYAISFGMVDAASPINAFLLCAGILMAPSLIFSLFYIIASGRKLHGA